MCPDLTRRHLGVAVGFLFCVGKPVQLRLPGSKNPFPYLRRAFRYARGTHLFVVHSGHVDMDVDTIHEWARDLRDIALDLVLIPETSTSTSMMLASIPYTAALKVL